MAHSNDERREQEQKDLERAHVRLDKVEGRLTRLEKELKVIRREP